MAPIRFRPVPLLLAALAGAAPAAAQVKAGGEFRVNVGTIGDQYDSFTATAPSGDFVVVWTDVTVPGEHDVFGRRYASDGTPRGTEFRVHSDPLGQQYHGRVAVHRDGSFVVVWATLYPPQVAGIWAQQFDAAGTRRGSPLRVNTDNGADHPELAMDARGNFVVAWWEATSSDPTGGIAARRVSAQGVPIGLPFQVNEWTTGPQFGTAVAMSPAGAFVIAWGSAGPDGDVMGISARRYDAGGVAGGEFVVNTTRTGLQRTPAAASDGAGNFVVTWTSYPQDGDGVGIFGQVFLSSGAPVGGEFQANTYTVHDQEGSSVHMAETGPFVVTWSSVYQDGSSVGVFGQRFHAGGARRGGEFQLHTFTAGNQRQPTVGMDPTGNPVVSWESGGQDGSGFGVYAQRFGGLFPASLAVDTAGNAVLEPGESVDVRPAWRNVNGAAQTFGGTVIDHSGPPGMSFGVLDGTAAYGTVPTNAVGGCTDCYAVSASAIPGRPAAHLDAAIVESILPDTQGQQKIWLLHLGGSFTDVPIASPFYRFIETLLHKGITGGCTTDTYCPAASTTREQMAVFVLVAKEGAGYRPPPCGATPTFADVPVTSPYCRWVEELARRGIVGGCGGGFYCPGVAVPRDQMAVFVLRTLDPVSIPPACAPPNLFSDVSETSPYCEWIEELARRGIVTGCGGGDYCPQAVVTREQMGVFLTETFGLTLYGP